MRIQGKKKSEKVEEVLRQLRGWCWAVYEFHGTGLERSDRPSIVTSTSDRTSETVVDIWIWDFD